MLFGKLQQGVIENQQILTIAQKRAKAEDNYGTELAEISRQLEQFKGGFARDDGATIKKAYDGVKTENEEAAIAHKKIANGIRELVVKPFSKYCEAHERRVTTSHDELQSRLKLHDKQADMVRKLRNQYFNKCRLLEDIEEENKMAFQDTTSPSSQSSPKAKVPEIKEPQPRVQEDSDEEESLQIGDETFTPEQVKQVLAHMLTNIKLGETKVPILGTYQNVASGADIVEYLQREIKATTVSVAERIGQDLISHGFLRLVGSVGSTFANSSKLFYQFRPKVFHMTGIPEKKQTINRTFSLGSNSDFADSPVVGSLGEYLAGFNILNSQHPNETAGDRLRREQAEADERYKAGVRKLDILRCQLEEAMVTHFRFMEECEGNRLKAIKTVVLDFAGQINNVIPVMKSNVDKMMLFQETVQPESDLRYMLENYRTGSYAPKVQIYENYYSRVDEQTFGIDLEARARADKKRVPLIITTLLTYLDEHYPDLEGDAARQGVWTVNVPLAMTHNLRNAINDGKPLQYEVLQRFSIPVVAAVLKLYLLELPDSLVSSIMYDVMKTIYSTSTADSSDEARISVLINTLSQLRVPNIATLSGLMAHFTRFLELTSADEAYTAALAQTLAPMILRPRIQNALTMEEKHPYRLIRDLFTHHEPIFSELKRGASSNGVGAARDTRPRAVSSDESNRRANMEARQRAILAAGGSRSRAVSPGPSIRGHRRDRSSGPAETRFPIASSAYPAHGHRSRDTVGTTGSSSSGSRPNSLEVPGELPAHQIDPIASAPLQLVTNDSGEHAPMSAVSAIDGVADENAGVEKRNSLGRSSPATRFAANRKSGGLKRQSLHMGDHKRDSVGSLRDVEGAEGRPVGVSLTDKPMDD